jgi:hypothetical protein
MSSLAPIQVSAADKLRLLRRLDTYRRWESLDDKRQCIQCGEIVSGRDVEVVGGTRALGPLRLQCPTENCPAIPLDWIIPNNVVSERHDRAVHLPAELVAAGHGSEKAGVLSVGWFRRFFGQHS